MDETSRPEMCRAPLETVVLKAKQLDMDKPCAILSLAMDRPTLTDIENTILLLKESGGLLRTVDGVYHDDDGDMTFIGHVMAQLPVNFRVAKLIVLGHCYSVLSECIIIGKTFVLSFIVPLSKRSGKSSRHSPLIGNYPMLNSRFKAKILISDSAPLGTLSAPTSFLNATRKHFPFRFYHHSFLFIVVCQILQLRSRLCSQF